MNREQTGTLEGLMEEMVHPQNWEEALRRVERNGGAPGPDGMKAGALRAHLKEHGEVIRQRLLSGRYRPGPVRRKEIAKPDGGVRALGIPDVQDRFVQQLLLLVLEPRFEPAFSEHSHGFRRGRGTQSALAEAKRHAQTGRTWVVDMDITRFFDHVNHDILMSKVGARIRDKRILCLIGAYLRAGTVMPDGVVVAGSDEGTPQGGPLSPLLANIYLDELDKELGKRGLAFCRYADDCNIYVSSEAAAQRVLEGMSRWITRRLKLQVNAKKSGTGRPWERKFLGMILTTTLVLCISPQSIGRFEDRVRRLWDARQSLSSVQLRDQWKQYVTGWWGYYQHADDHRPVYRREGWIRRHMRKCYWQRWHGRRGRQRALRRLGLPESRVKAAASSRGAWRMAGSPTMHEALGNRTLSRYGYVMPSDLARQAELVSNRRMRKTARPVVWEP